MTAHYIWKNRLVQTSSEYYWETEFAEKSTTWVFTTFVVTYLKERENFAIWGLMEHLNRLFFHALHEKIHFSDNVKDDFRKSLLSLLASSAIHFGEIKVRLSTRISNEIVISIEKFEQIPIHANGITAITVSNVRQLPEIKSSLDLAASASAYAEALRAGANEALLIDKNGIVREGAWSNIFWFDHKGVLHTTKTGVLPGITREAILSLIPCKLYDCPLSELLTVASELFITKSTTGISAVVAVDNKAIGNGHSGKYTTELKSKFNDYINENAILLDDVRNN